jgi:acetate kinase
VRVLTLNAGSATLKHALFDARGGAVDRRDGGVVDLDGGHAELAARVVRAVAEPDPPVAVGHRIVHGGPRHDGPAIVDDALRAELGALTDLAPLHMPPALAVLDAARERLPGAVHVACFDTAFHRALPEVAQRLPLPDRYWREGVRRYGFHGLSYTSALAVLGPAAARGRVLVIHLGNGCSMAAVRDGRPVDTTMSFTPAAGLVMGTRTGDIDPGVLVHLIRTEGLGADDLERLVTRESGLRGISGGTSDMRDLLARRGTDPAAARAVDAFVWAARRQAGAMAASLGGLDLVAFTGGIGERSPEVRAEVCAGLGHLGVVLDDDRNRAGTGRISADGAACAVHVVPADEERVLAEAAAAAVTRRAPVP